LNDDPNGNRFLPKEDVNPDDGMPTTVEYLSQAPTQHVPLDFHFVGMRQDDDPNNLDNFSMAEVPRNAKI
jgi:hypothetical protein